MFPVPFLENIPKLFRDHAAQGTIAFTDKMDEIIEGLRDEIKELGYQNNPARMKSVCLDELGYQLGAEIQALDSDAVKRAKISTAASTQRYRSTWTSSVKLRIDSIVGMDSKIISSVGSDDDVDCGKGDEPALYYWSGEGGKDASADYGVYEYGKGIEPGVKGVVRIDVDDSTLTTSEVENLKNQLLDLIPAYMIIILGYMSGGIFVAYANGIMS